MMIKSLTALLALSVLGGCMTVRIDETSVFEPIAFDAKLAEESGERMLGEKSFGSADVWNGNWNYWSRTAKGLPEAIAPFTAASVQHGRFDSTTGGLAWTTVARETGSDTLIVRCGGNATTRQRNGYRASVVSIPHGDVLLFDYPGYGETGGEATPERFQAMASELVPLVREKAAGRRIVLWGHSLGGLVCSELAARLPETAGIIIETSARNAREVAQAWTPWYASLFVNIEIAPGFGDIDVASALKAFKGPVLVLGAEKDDTLPVQLSRSLAEALKSQGTDVTYVEFKEGRHSNLPVFATFAPTIADFFTRLGKAS
jgi:pimeloyl-ACP methyl ester carboxylesterase